MVKPARIADVVEVTYEDAHWGLLEKLQQRAQKLMTVLEAQGISSVVHGSVARGDVKPDSDVDVMIIRPVPSYKVGVALDASGIRPIRREIVMATPWQLPKAHVYIEDDYSVTFPLIKPKRLELEFYYFGGAADLGQVKNKTRVPGVDKRLMLIEPTDRGHRESQIKGREAEVAKRVGVGLDIVRERVQVLTRRADIGRTGIFVQRALAPDENFEEVFKRLVTENPEMKIRLKGRLP